MASAHVLLRVGGEPLVLKFKKHVIALDTAGDKKVIEALRDHPRHGILFREILPNEKADTVKDQGRSLEVLTNMDKAAIWTYFTQGEIDGLGLDLHSTKSDLIAGFISLNKAL
jgi:hypothetical protein